MSDEGFEPDIRDWFGGLCTKVRRGACPPNLSPDASDVRFDIGTVRSRGGLTQHWASPRSGTWVAEYTKPDGTRLFLTMDTNGTLRVESASYAMSDVDALWEANGVTQGITLYSRKLFQHQPMNTESAAIMGYDGLALRRVSHEGPPVPDDIVDGGVGASFNVNGRRMYFVVYEFDDGTASIPSVIRYTDAIAAGRFYTIPAPIGPAGCVRRVLYITAVGGEQFWTHRQPIRVQSVAWEVGSFVVEGNGAASFGAVPVVGVNGFDFTDETLVNGGENGNTLLNQGLTWGGYAVGAYNNRVVNVGTRVVPHRFDTMTTEVSGGVIKPYSLGFHNLTFDASVAAAGSPPSWTVVGGAGTGTIASVPGATGNVLRIYGNAADPSFLNDGSNKVPYTTALNSIGDQFYIDPSSRRYGVKIRMRRSPPISGIAPPESFGGFTITTELRVGSTSPAATPILQCVVNWNDLTEDWKEFEAVQTSKTTQNYDYIRAYGYTTLGNRLGNGTYYFDVDFVQIFDADAGRTVQFSEPFNPGAWDKTEGYLDVNLDDGQDPVTAFQLRGNLYLVEERGLYSTTDNEQNPSAWKVELMSSECGATSPNGVALGDGGWAIIAGREGVYYFTGGTPELLSDEIRPTWDEINWSMAKRMWVEVFTEQQLIVIGVPTGANEHCNKLYILDYCEGFGNPVEQDGRGRRWSTWTIGSDACDVVLRPDGTKELLFLERRTQSNSNRIPAANYWYQGSAETPAGPWTKSGAIPVTYPSTRKGPFGEIAGAKTWASWALPAAARTAVIVTGSIAPNVLWLGSIYARLQAAGPITAFLDIDAGGLATASAAVVLTSSWQRFTVALDATAVAVPPGVYVTGMTFRVTSAVAADVDIAYPQIASGYASIGPALLASAEMGNLAGYDETVYNDCGYVRPSRYETGPFQYPMGRTTYRRMVLRGFGSSNLDVSAKLPDTSTVTVGTLAVVDPSLNEYELGLPPEMTSWHAGLVLSTDALNEWWYMEKLAVWRKPHVAALKRGHN